MLEEKVYTIEEIEIIKPYGFIYITTNKINGKKYIGQKALDRKWKIYLGSGTYLKNAIKKYGKESFNREIVAVVDSKEKMNELEIEFIKNYNAVESNDYYNIAIGGSCATAGIHWSEESRQKLSDSRTGMTGISFSEKGKQNMSEAHKGLKHSEETKRKIGLGNKGKIISAKQKEQLSIVHKNKIISEATRKKMSDALRILVDEQVIEVRKKYASGTYTYLELAQEYKVGETMIGNIVKFRGVYANII